MINILGCLSPVLPLLALLLRARNKDSRWVSWLLMCGVLYAVGVLYAGHVQRRAVVDTQIRILREACLDAKED